MLSRHFPTGNNSTKDFLNSKGGAKLKIEILYFEGCPNYEPTLKLLNQVLEEEGIHTCVQKIDVSTDESVRENRFLGSPSIRINGADIETAARDSRDHGKKCRIYNNTGAPGGIPSKSMIREALLKAQRNHLC